MRSFPTHRKRFAFTLIELLVVIAIIAVLIALLVPAVQKVREAAARAQCQNNMKQLGLASHTYHSQMKVFPPGTFTSPPSGNNHHVASWAVAILPFLDQEPMYRQLNLSALFYSVAITTIPLPNVDLLKDFAPKVFICPSTNLPVFTTPEDLRNPPPGWGDHILMGNYVGIMGSINAPNSPTEPGTGATSLRVVDRRPIAPAGLNQGGIYATNGVIFHGSKIRATDISDGTSNTFIFGEQSDWGSSPGVGTPSVPIPQYDIRAPYRGGIWAGSNIEGGSSVTVRYPINTKARVGFQDGIARYGWNTPIQSVHSGGAFMARCDGGAMFVSQNMPFDVLKYLCTRDDNQTVAID